MSHPPGPPDESAPTPESPYPSTGAGPGEPPPHAPGPVPGDQPGPGHFYPPPQYGQYGQYGQGGQGGPYGHPGQYGQGPGSYPPNNGMATASLITGISSLVLSWCCGLGLVGVVAVVLGVRARRQIRERGGVQSGDGMAVGGIVTGALAILFGVATIVLLVVLIASGSGDFGTGTRYGTRL